MNRSALIRNALRDHLKRLAQKERRGEIGMATAVIPTISLGPAGMHEVCVALGFALGCDG